MGIEYITDSYIQTYWCGDKRCSRVVTTIYTIEKKRVKQFFNDIKEEDFYKSKN